MRRWFPKLLSPSAARDIIVDVNAGTGMWVSPSGSSAIGSNSHEREVAYGEKCRLGIRNDRSACVLLTS